MRWSEAAKAARRGRLALAQQPAVEGFVAGDDGLGGEDGPGFFAGGAAEGFAFRAVADQRFDRTGEVGGLSGRNEEAVDIVGNDFGDTADGGADAGAAEGHRFENAEAETFGIGGEDGDVGGVEIIFDVEDVLADDEAVGDAELLGGELERCEVAAGEDEEFEGVAAIDARDRFEEAIDAFDGAEI